MREKLTRYGPYMGVEMDRNVQLKKIHRRFNRNSCPLERNAAGGLEGDEAQRVAA